MTQYLDFEEEELKEVLLGAVKLIQRNCEACGKGCVDCPLFNKETKFCSICGLPSDWEVNKK